MARLASAIRNCSIASPALTSTALARSSVPIDLLPTYRTDLISFSSDTSKTTTTPPAASGSTRAWTLLNRLRPNTFW